MTGELFHVERRPSEGGRSVIVNSTSHKDLVDKNWNVRTGVHEYGGVAATVSNGVIFFSNYTDGRVYRTTGDSTPEPVTPGGLVSARIVTIGSLGGIRQRKLEIRRIDCCQSQSQHTRRCTGGSHQARTS